MKLTEYIEKIIAERGLVAKVAERNIGTKDIVDYLTIEAKKLAIHGCAAIDDTTIANWIVHYIEDAYKENEPTGEQVKEETKKPTACEKINKQNKERKKEKDDGMFTSLSLFDFGGQNE